MQRGWLSWPRSRYEIAPGRIIVKRSWIPAFFVPLLPVGPILVYVMIDSVKAEPQDPAPIVIGVFAAVACFVLGLIGAYSAPWRAPRKLVATSAGVAIDDKFFDRDEVTSFTIDAREFRSKNGVSYGIGIEVNLTTSMPPRFAVCDARERSPARVEKLVRELNQVIGRR